MERIRKINKKEALQKTTRLVSTGILLIANLVLLDKAIEYKNEVDTLDRVANELIQSDVYGLGIMCNTVARLQKDEGYPEPLTQGDCEVLQTKQRDHWSQIIKGK